MISTTGSYKLNYAVQQNSIQNLVCVQLKQNIHQPAVYLMEMQRRHFVAGKICKSSQCQNQFSGLADFVKLSTFCLERYALRFLRPSHTSHTPGPAGKKHYFRFLKQLNKTKWTVFMQDKYSRHILLCSSWSSKLG